MLNDWTLDAAKEICKHMDYSDRSDIARTQKIIEAHCPFKKDVAYQEVETAKAAKVEKSAK